MSTVSKLVSRLPVAIFHMEENLNQIIALTSIEGRFSFFVGTNERDYVNTNKIEKTTEFGGGAGSGAGTKKTNLFESLFALFCGIALLKKSDIDKDDVNILNIKKVIGSKAFLGKTSFDDMISFISENEDWVNVTIKMVNKIRGEGYLSSSTTSHRDSTEMKKIYSVFNSLKKPFEKLYSISMNENKWNPGDVWLIDNSIDIKDVTSKVSNLKEYNNILLKLFRSKKIVGVSLKKTSSPKLKVINDGDIKNQINDKFKKLFSKKPNLSSSKDFYIVTNEMNIQLRNFGVTDNIQGEIIGKEAKHGKIGLGNLNFILTTSFSKSQSEIDKVRKKFDIKNKSLIIPSKEIPKLDPTSRIDYIEHLFTKITGNPPSGKEDEEKMNKDSWYISKLQALEISYIIHVAPKKTKDEIINKINGYANSLGMGEDLKGSVFIKIH